MTTLGDIVAALGGELVGDASLPILRLAPLDTADPSALSFLHQPRYLLQLGATRAGAVIVAPPHREAAAARGAAIVTDQPYLYFARLTQWWAARHRRRPSPGVHAMASVEEGARVHASASVAAFAVIESGAVIGPDAVVGAHVFVGADARIGSQTRLAAHVVLAEGCSIGKRGIVHGGAVLGADGFGFAPVEGRWEKIEQLGAVVIGDDVEIGAKTCIDRGALDDT
ncbi:MAG: UDP-3-O-(3-hydroxymyristoyl)glucosamine N-acyltransferase, partial [Aquabacterium sp.]